MLDSNIILIGYSGHGKVVADAAIENGLNILGYSDKKIIANNPFNLKYLGCEVDDTFIGWELSSNFLIGIGDNYVRENIFKSVTKKEKNVITLISTSSIISKYSTVGYGTFVNNNVTINASSKIGMNVILNTGCIVEHECIIENSAHIAPGAVLAGNVKIGNRTFIGANSVIKQGVEIGDDVIIGAGSVIIENVSNNSKIVGNPGRK